MLILDTNFIIAHLGGEREATDLLLLWKQEYITLAISTITECELFSFSKMTNAETVRIANFLNEYLVIFAFDSSAARIAGTMRQQFPHLKLPDAGIAALALDRNAQLVTRNVKDFKHIAQLQVVTF